MRLRRLLGSLRGRHGHLRDNRRGGKQQEKQRDGEADGAHAPSFPESATKCTPPLISPQNICPCRVAAGAKEAAKKAYWSSRLPSTGTPVLGLRTSMRLRWSSKSNMPFNVPAIASVDPLPIRPRSQLSSIKRVIEDWSVTRWST